MGRYEDQLRLTLAAFNERGPAVLDDPAMLALAREWIDPEVESLAAGGIQGGTYHGIDGLIEMVRGFTSAFSELTAEIEEVLEETEHSLVATVRYRGRGASSGAPIDEVYVWAQRFEDGKAVTYVIDRDRDRAIRAAGLAD
jgi:ketosteroid isomerase-like protein